MVSKKQAKKLKKQKVETPKTGSDSAKKSNDKKDSSIVPSMGSSYPLIKSGYPLMSSVKDNDSDDDYKVIGDDYTPTQSTKPSSTTKVESSKSSKSTKKVPVKKTVTKKQPKQEEEETILNYDQDDEVQLDQLKKKKPAENSDYMRPNMSNKKLLEETNYKVEVVKQSKSKFNPKDLVGKQESSLMAWD